MTPLELIEAAVREINAGNDDSFGTFEVKGNEERWLQYLQGNINAVYPSAAAPEAYLATLPFDDMIEWRPNNFLAVVLNKPPEEVAVWIDRYFREVLRCEPDYQLTWRREQ